MHTRVSGSEAEQELRLEGQQRGEKGKENMMDPCRIRDAISGGVGEEEEQEYEIN